MAYTTHSDSSPDKNTSFINTSLNRLVQNNPYHPAAPNILWPTYYDVFVNKTDDQQVSVSVSDEKHLTGDIDVSNNNALYMNHKPRLGSTVESTFGTLDTGLTDYNHGVVYFSALPASDFTLTYLADPDKYYGEYLSQMQDVLHKLEIWAGAGSTKNEGVRSAEVLVKSTNAKIDSKLPKRIHVQGLAEDISFKSLDGQPGHTITLGNSNDVVEINANEFKVYCGSFEGGSALDPMTGTITDHTGDILNMIGLVSMSPTGTTRSTGITDAAVTSALFLDDSGRDQGVHDALRVYGNTYIAGNLFTLGGHTVINSQAEIQVNTFQEDLQVNGDAYLGNGSADKVYIAGDLTVSGRIDQVGSTTEHDVTINRDIILNNHGGTTPSLVDGLDPSYIANRHKYMRPAGPDWCGDTVNICSIGQMAEDGTLTGGAASTATQDSTTGDLVVDTTISSNALLVNIAGGGLYYTDRFNDGTWIFDIRSGPSAGEKIPIAAYNSATTSWQLSRTLSSLPASGMSYRIYNPYFCNPDFVALNGNDFDITASTTNPVVADVRGIVKSNVNADTASVNSADSGTKYLSLANENSVASAGLESDGVWYGSDYGVPSDQSILVAEAEHNGGSTFDQLTTYRPAGKYDSTWRKFASTTPTIYHNLGGDFRAQDYKVTIHTAGTSADGPGAVTQITTGAISPIDRKTAVIEVPSTDTWVRIKIEV